MTVKYVFNPTTGKLDATDKVAFNGEVNLGTAAAPSIFFTGDPNTGIYSPGADQLAISTAGQGRLFVDASGRIGVGTASPSQPLHIVGTTASALFEGSIQGGITIQKAGTLGINLVSDQAGTLIFYNLNGNNERARIDSSGRLLVGTVSARGVGGPVAWQSYIEGNSGSGTYPGLAIVDNSTGSEGPYLALGKSKSVSVGSSTLVAINDSLGAIVFAGADGTDLHTQGAKISCFVDGTPGANDMPGRLVFSTTADGASSPTERMRITNAGATILYGNGAASTSALSSVGTWFTGGTGTTTKPQLLIEPTGTTSTAWSTSGTGLGVNAAASFGGNLLDLQINGSSKVRFTSGGLLDFDAAGTGFLRDSGGGNIRWRTGGTDKGELGSGAIRVFGNASLNFGDSSDVVIIRDAANTLAQRNGTNAQTYRLYNTYTDASNYSRFSTSFSGNNVILNLERAGTGSFGDIVFAVGGINSAAIINSPGRSIRIPNGGDYGWSSDNSATGVSDTGLVRSAASVVKVTNGSTGDGTLLAQHRLAGTAPATASSSGTAGDIRYDADYIYVCTATNTWKRAALATW